MHENNCRTNKKYVGAAAFISKNYFKKLLHKMSLFLFCLLSHIIIVHIHNPFGIVLIDSKFTL